MKMSRGSFLSLLAAVLAIVTAPNLPAQVPDSTSAGDQTPLAMAPARLGAHPPAQLPGNPQAIPPAMGTGMPAGAGQFSHPGYMQMGMPGAGAMPGFNRAYPVMNVGHQPHPSQMTQMPYRNMVHPASHAEPPRAFPGLQPTPMDPQYYAGHTAMGGPMGGPMAGPDAGCDSCKNQGCKYCNCGICGGSGGNCGCGHRGYAAGLVGGALARGLQMLLPFAEGGCCAPRVYDVYIDGVYLKREQASRFVEFARQGNVTALSTDNLDFDAELGMRLTAALQVHPGTSAEFTYFGLFDWASSATATSNDVNNLLFSTYSNFGAVNPSDQADNSTFQQINYSTTLNSFEANFRRRWIGPNCKLQGSWLMGARYVYLYEDFDYQSNGGASTGGGMPMLRAPQGEQITRINTLNSLTGFQIGGDLWTCVVPGISVGGEIKAGAYGLYAKSDTDATAVDSVGAVSFSLPERDVLNDIAFVGEGRLEMIWRSTPHLTFRSGLTFMLLDGVALAPENFIRAPAPNFTPTGGAPRPLNRNDDGSVFYSGAHAGFEYIW